MSATTDRSVLDPVGVIVDLVTAADPGIGAATVTDVVVRVAGGRAKQRRLAAALVGDPDVLTHGRSPAPRAIGNLLIALRRAGATGTVAPRCATCGKPLRTLQRRGQDWLCGPCALRPEPCAGCGQLRHVSSRDRRGRPRCVRCPDDDGISDPLAAITQAVKTVDAHLGDAAIVAAVHAALPDRRHHRKLARALVDNPRLLTGAGHLAPVPSVLRLIDALVDGGSTCVQRPACGRCHRVVRLSKSFGGQRICRRCIAGMRAEPCSRCGAVREPATRDAAGLPLCPYCLSSDEINQEDCMGCGRRRPISVRTSAGPLCPNCRPLPTLTCATCGRDAPCEISQATGRPWCKACRQHWARCTRCGQTQPLRGGTREEPLCSACTRPEPGFWRQCPTCGRADRLRDGPCARCVLDERLHHLLAGPDGNIRSELAPLHRALRSTEYPPSTQAWLSRSSTSQLLGELARGGRPLSHQVLDELGTDKTARHLRAMLIAAGALPPHDEHLARLEQWLDQTIASVADHRDRYLLHRYAVWHHLRRLRRRAGPTGISYGQVVGLRRVTTAAIAFLKLVAAHDLTLVTCRQADLDHWLAHDRVPYRRAAGAFVRWATANKLAHLDFPATRWLGPTGPIDAERRWETARRLLHDDTLAVADRVAGLLVVLYAQRVSAIARLTVDDVAINGDRVDIQLGSVPVALPQPLATLATDLVAARRGHAVTGNPGTSPWLFPGGQPGRPISAYRLGERLTSVGITVGKARTAALFQLATELPAAVLARTLGIHIQVAVQWQRAASADWATYAAELARRGPPHGR